MTKRTDKQFKTNENKQWDKLAVDQKEDQKSYAVRLLHYFHYNPRLTLKSWTREEVLTWELLHALQILPRNIFLRRILKACTSTSKDGAIAAAYKNALIHVTVEPYPNLGLGGNKRNSKSDIGFHLKGESWIWLEAKTAPVPPQKLSHQLAIQRSALDKLNPNHSNLVIPLVPDTQSPDLETALRWKMIAATLQQTIEELKSNPASELLEGQINIAIELYKRITTHEPNLIS